jgi:hypothetical protein
VVPEVHTASKRVSVDGETINDVRSQHQSTDMARCGGSTGVQERGTQDIEAFENLRDPMGFCDRKQVTVSNNKTGGIVTICRKSDSFIVLRAWESHVHREGMSAGRQHASGTAVPRWSAGACRRD